MFNSIINSSTGSVDATGLFICIVISIILGVIISFVHMSTSVYTKNFAITLALLPVMVQAVIYLVNGNLGTGVAVLGAFSLVRFRSVPGSSKEISSIFLAMAVGLATGMGFVGYAILFTIVSCVLMFVLAKTSFGEQRNDVKELKITIPENLDYSDIFDDIFETYVTKRELDHVKTTNMGSMYQLCYEITLKDSTKEKEMIDAIRCRNGNLTISCGRPTVNKEQL